MNFSIIFLGVLALPCMVLTAYVCDEGWTKIPDYQPGVGLSPIHVCVNYTGDTGSHQEAAVHCAKQYATVVRPTTIDEEGALTQYMRDTGAEDEYGYWTRFRRRQFKYISTEDLFKNKAEFKEEAKNGANFKDIYGWAEVMPADPWRVTGPQSPQPDNKDGSEPCVCRKPLKKTTPGLDDFPCDIPQYLVCERRAFDDGFEVGPGIGF